MITVKCVLNLDHFKIREFIVFAAISLSPFNFVNISSKKFANLAASNVTLTSCANTVQAKMNTSIRKLNYNYN